MTIEMLIASVVYLLAVLGMAVLVHRSDPTIGKRAALACGGAWPIVALCLVAMLAGSPRYRREFVQAFLRSYERSARERQLQDALNDALQQLREVRRTLQRRDERAVLHFVTTQQEGVRTRALRDALIQALKRVREYRATIHAMGSHGTAPTQPVEPLLMHTTEWAAGQREREALAQLDTYHTGDYQRVKAIQVKEESFETLLALSRAFPDTLTASLALGPCGDNEVRVTLLSETHGVQMARDGDWLVYQEDGKWEVLPEAEECWLHPIQHPADVRAHQDPQPAAAPVSPPEPPPTQPPKSDRPLPVA